MILKPQEGFQTKFLVSNADITIGGGAAGAGKSFSLLLDPLRYADVQGFGGTIFRRTTPQIRNQGALWDESEKIYPFVGASGTQSRLKWRFANNNYISFSHLEHEKTKLDYAGSQIPYIGFDEITQFSMGQFFYMISRNRSTCGVTPYVKGTCNPDPDSWVAGFIDWWIDPETGFPIPERDGVLRYFMRDGGNFVWGDTKLEVIMKCPHLFRPMQERGIDVFQLVKSVTFIAGNVYDNKKLLDVNPEYLGNLMSLPDEERLPLLDGNWKISTDGTSMCKYTMLQEIFSNYCTGYPYAVEGTQAFEDELRKNETGRDNFITLDAARYGKDLAVLIDWHKNFGHKIMIWTKCSIPDQIEAIEGERKEYSVPKSCVIVDEGGLGAGIVDAGYRGFVSNARALPNPEREDRKDKTPENYDSLKTQCWYRFCRDFVNMGDVRFTSDNIWVDGRKTTVVRVGGTEYNVLDLIRKDLRSAKRRNADRDAKRQMITKEQQKNALSGRSPDLGDCSIMRVWHFLQEDLIPEL